jgi:hypothetical protein
MRRNVLVTSQRSRLSIHWATLPRTHAEPRQRPGVVCTVSATFTEALYGGDRIGKQVGDTDTAGVLVATR